MIVLGASLVLLTALSGCSLSGEVEISALEVGDCFNYSGAEESFSLTSVTTVDCNGAHDFEVYFVPLADQPEDSSVCMDEFETFVGMDYVDSFNEYAYGYWNLFSTSTTSGELLTTCAIFATDDDGNLEQVTGSLKGAES